MMKDLNNVYRYILDQWEKNPSETVLSHGRVRSIEHNSLRHRIVGYSAYPGGSINPIIIFRMPNNIEIELERDIRKDERGRRIFSNNQVRSFSGLTWGKVQFDRKTTISNDIKNATPKQRESISAD